MVDAMAPIINDCAERRQTRFDICCLFSFIFLFALAYNLCLKTVPYFKKTALSRYQGTPRNIFRHVILSDIKDASTSLPRVRKKC